ncbi:flavin-containing monooxygenase [Flexivirga endophytica]|nr:NAD(P)/FAD-dependent oxidoreductase [Flexivirga endophytica]
MSESLTALGVPHVVLERNRIAERWRSERWDSLVSNGPAWHDRLPGRRFSGVPGETFASKDQIADYLEEYAEQVAAPVRCGVEVTEVRRRPDSPGFRVETTDGDFDARFVIAATGPFQTPTCPDIVPADSGLLQLHSRDYKNPGQLPDGNVLVVGSGSSGAQIADELQRAGRQVHLSVSAHTRPPRTYRGRDIVWWLGVLGLWDQQVPRAGAEHVTLAISGANGGSTIDFRRLAASGIKLVGRTESFDEGMLRFAPGLAETIAAGDDNYLGVLDTADAYVARNGLDLPEEPQARELGPLPDCVTDPIREVDLADSGITSVIWATGFSVDYSWLKVAAVDDAGKPVHQRGISPEPGIYFVGLPWLTRRSSSFLCGVSGDARYLAEHIAVQRNYLAYQPALALIE